MCGCWEVFAVEATYITDCIYTVPTYVACRFYRERGRFALPSFFDFFVSICEIVSTLLVPREYNVLCACATAYNLTNYADCVH